MSLVATRGPDLGGGVVIKLAPGRQAEAKSKALRGARRLMFWQARRYEGFLGKVRDILKPLLDGPPPDITQGNPRERLSAAVQLGQLMQNGFKHRGELVPLYELLSGPAAQILDRWFESDILKVTLACDAVIGAMTSPYHAGSGYVLLHHVVGEAAGRQGVWA